MNQVNYKVLLFDDAGEDVTPSETTLPFVPYPGLHLRVPFRNMDHAKINGVYWDDEKELFEVFFE